MSIIIKAYANPDDVLIAWQPDTLSDDWVGFQLEPQRYHPTGDRLGQPDPAEAWRGADASHRHLVDPIRDPPLSFGYARKYERAYSLSQLTSAIIRSGLDVRRSWARCGFVKGV